MKTSLENALLHEVILQLDDLENELRHCDQRGQEVTCAEKVVIISDGFETVGCFHGRIANAKWLATWITTQITKT